MKRIDKFSELPEEAIDFFGIDGEEDLLTWKEWENELIYSVKDGVGFGGKPKIVIGEPGYLHSFELELENDVTIVAQIKSISLNHCFICDGEDHGLFIK